LCQVGEKLVSGTFYEGLAISIYNDAPIVADVTCKGTEAHTKLLHQFRLKQKPQSMAFAFCM